MLHHWLHPLLALAVVALEAQAAGTAADAFGKGHLALRWHRGLAVRKRGLKAARALVPAGTLTAAQGCTQYHQVVAGDTCYGVSQQYGLQEWSTLREWNDVDSNCGNLWLGYSYCVAGPTGGSPPSTPSSTSTATSRTSTTTSSPSSTRQLPSSSTLTSRSSSTQTSSSPKPTATSSTRFQKGQATWYHAGLGACGKWNTDSDLIVAASKLVWDSWPGATANPNLHPICGKRIRVKRGSKSVDVTVVDMCPECAANHIDLSPSAFKRLATLDEGLVSVGWRFM